MGMKVDLGVAQDFMLQNIVSRFTTAISIIIF